MSMSVLNIFGKPLDANFVSNALICNDFTPPRCGSLRTEYQF